MAVLCIGLFIGGCGYHFSEVAESLSGIRKIYVDNFPNRTEDAYLENYFRNALIDQFIRGNQFEVVGDVTEADAVVRGTILRVTSSHTAYDNADLAAEERATLLVHIVFEDRETGRTLWEDRNFSGSEDYLVDSAMNSGEESSDIEALGTKKKALIKLSSDMAERAYRLMIADF
ncbi:MAG: LptE family protein [Syntrophaceae bacterium]|nr:LptE family protein [Syntrophaceae bacterium]